MDTLLLKYKLVFRKKRGIFKRGFALIEALLATSIFALLATAFIGSLIYGEKSTTVAGSRSRALFLAEEGLEAVRNIRDEDFNKLTDGTFGLAITDNSWKLSGSSDLTEIFNRQISISSIDPKIKKVASTVSWQDVNEETPHFISVTTYLSKWKEIAGSDLPMSCDVYCMQLPVGYISGICRSSVGACKARGEISERGGDKYCTIDKDKFCCCAP
ncbi:MAG: hypothetical protein QMD65_01685 [Patescibacteria group bacterium]|nr:hypothetical protein [Patescibacteria group bacterium]